MKSNQRDRRWIGESIAFSIFVATIATALLVTGGCHKVTVTGTPPGIVAPEVAAWYQATGAVKVWSDASLALTQSAVNLKSEFPSSDSYQKTLEALGKENSIGLPATHFLQTVPQNFNATSQTALGNYLDQGLALLDQATQVGALQIKNADAKAAVDAATTSLRAALKTIFALVKPAGTPLPASLGGN